MIGKRSPFFISVLFFLNLLSITVFAHDFWIEPSSFRPLPDALVDIKLLVGNPFQGEAEKRDSTRIVKFVIINAKEEKPVLGFDGKDPVGYLRLHDPGLYLIGYRSTGQKNVLEPGEFEKYLKLYGLEKIIAERARRNESQKPGREIFSRCAKSMILVPGDTAAAVEYDRLLGFTVELAPVKNPYRLKPGDQLPVRILYNGKGITDVLVVAANRNAPEKMVKKRSDKEGLVKFDLTGKGDWLITAVHMVPASDETHADWESFWASLSFEIGNDSQTPQRTK